MNSIVSFVDSLNSEEKKLLNDYLDKGFSVKQCMEVIDTIRIEKKKSYTEGYNTGYGVVYSYKV